MSVKRELFSIRSALPLPFHKEALRIGLRTAGAMVSRIHGLLALLEHTNDAATITTRALRGGWGGGGPQAHPGWRPFTCTPALGRPVLRVSWFSKMDSKSALSAEQSERLLGSLSSS